jgi:hypothetical protein
VGSAGSEEGPVAVYCECDDEPLGSGATELVDGYASFCNAQRDAPFE